MKYNLTWNSRMFLSSRVRKFHNTYFTFSLSQYFLFYYQVPRNAHNKGLTCLKPVQQQSYVPAKETELPKAWSWVSQNGIQIS